LLLPQTRDSVHWQGFLHSRTKNKETSILVFGH
jgi:hypothetical protein